MSGKKKREARLNVRLPAELEHCHRAQNVTALSNRDRDIFVALLDDADARPNKALTEAARRYKKHFG